MWRDIPSSSLLLLLLLEKELEVVPGNSDETPPYPWDELIVTVFNVVWQLEVDPAAELEPE